MNLLAYAIHGSLLCVIVQCSGLEVYHRRHSPDESERVGGNGDNRSRRSIDRSFAELNSRCFCSWRWVYDTDETRVPRTIRYAECLTRRCETRPLGLDFIIKRRMDRQTACVPTTIDFVIYVNGQQQVKTDMPVSCSCAYRHGAHTYNHPTNVDVSQEVDDYGDYDDGTQGEQHEEVLESSGSVNVSSAHGHRTRPLNNEQAYRRQWQALNVEPFSDYIRRQRTANRS